jgi:indole-3-glycerol phosphate synthase
MNILQTIAEYKREEVVSRKMKRKVSVLTEMPLFNRSAIPFASALTNHPPIGIIAEIKRNSPSAGVLRNNLDPGDIARQYLDGGAAAISVLTDERFFSGSVEDLIAVRESVGIPLMRKEFIIDEYQVIEAKAFGADAILLIAAILDKIQLSDLHEAALSLGLQCLVELYDISEINILDLDRMNLVGINNRDLRTFTVNTDRTLEISRHLPGNVIRVAESGINSPEILRKYISGGISAVLVGEYLMRAPHPGRALASLLKGINGEAAD